MMPTSFTIPADQVSTGWPRYTCLVKFSGVPLIGGPNQTSWPVPVHDHEAGVPDGLARVAPGREEQVGPLAAAGGLGDRDHRGVKVAPGHEVSRRRRWLGPAAGGWPAAAGLADGCRAAGGVSSVESGCGHG